jgi:mannose-6-phosphate isomerase-like protein (cupin superfamily)
MKRKNLRFGHGFAIVLGNDRSQAAQMTLAPGKSEGGSDNRHRGADQWLYIVSGAGEVVINGKRYPLQEGSLVLIESGDTHEIRNTGEEPLKTLSVYVPPAYTPEGDELPRGKK